MKEYTIHGRNEPKNCENRKWEEYIESNNLKWQNQKWWHKFFKKIIKYQRNDKFKWMNVLK